MSTMRSLAALVGMILILTFYRIWLIGHLGIDAYVDEAQYWYWSEHLAWGYYSKPPAIAGLIALSTAIFGNTLVAIKLPSLLLYPATALVLWALTRRLFQDNRLAFWVGFGFISMPLVAALGLFVSTDAPLLFCWALSLFFLDRALKTAGWSDWIQLGVWVGFGLMSKYTMLAFVAAAFLVMLTSPSGRTALKSVKPWGALLIAGIILLPNLIWNAENGFPTFAHTAEITRLEQRGWAPGELLNFLGAQWLSLGPILGVMAVVAFLNVRGMLQDARLRMLAIMVLPLFVLVCFQALTGRANGNWAAPIFVGTLPFTMAVFQRMGRWRWVVIAVWTNLVLTTLAAHVPDVARAVDRPLTRQTDPFKRARGWAEFGKAVAVFQRQYPRAVVVTTDREILSQILFYVRPIAYASWNPSGTVHDHYQLTTTLNDKVGRDMLFVATKPLGAEVLSRYETAQKLGTVDIPVYPDLHRRAEIWLLTGFRGYREH